jgi:hypothetical protein
MESNYSSERADEKSFDNNTAFICSISSASFLFLRHSKPFLVYNCAPASALPLHYRCGLRHAKIRYQQYEAEVNSFLCECRIGYLKGRSGIADATMHLYRADGSNLPKDVYEALGTLILTGTLENACLKAGASIHEMQ